MITVNEMIVVFIDAAGRTVGSFTRILAVKDVTNWQDAMSPFHKEIGSAVVAVTYE